MNIKNIYLTNIKSNVNIIFVVGNSASGKSTLASFSINDYAIGKPIPLVPPTITNVLFLISFAELINFVLFFIFFNTKP